MANRITDAFARMKAQIADRIANGLTSADCAEVCRRP